MLLTCEVRHGTESALGDCEHCADPCCSKVLKPDQQSMVEVDLPQRSISFAQLGFLGLQLGCN